MRVTVFAVCGGIIAGGCIIMAVAVCGGVRVVVCV